MQRWPLHDERKKNFPALVLTAFKIIFVLCRSLIVDVCVHIISLDRYVYVHMSTQVSFIGSATLAQNQSCFVADIERKEGRKEAVANLLEVFYSYILHYIRNTCVRREERGGWGRLRRSKSWTEAFLLPALLAWTTNVRMYVWRVREGEKTSPKARTHIRSCPIDVGCQVKASIGKEANVIYSYIVERVDQFDRGLAKRSIGKRS